jgi:hypothetical protein
MFAEKLDDYQCDILSSFSYVFMNFFISDHIGGKLRQLMNLQKIKISFYLHWSTTIKMDTPMWRLEMEMNFGSTPILSI